MRTILFCFFLAFTATACGGSNDEIAPGHYYMTMSFQGAELAGAADIGPHGVGTWKASNPENSYSGDVVTSEDGTVWWFGPAYTSAFELRTIDGRSTDPAIDATIVLTR